MRPPPGRTWSWRRVVVWRPRASSSRIAAVAATSPPASRLSNVDFPTPDEPTKATVRPGPIRSPDLVDAPAVDRADGEDRGPGRGPLDRRERLGDLVLAVEIDLGQDHDRLRAAVPGGREIALEAAEVQVAFRDATTKTTSRFAPTTCAAVSVPPPGGRAPSAAAGRAWMTVSSLIPPSTTTQSPTAGNAAGSSLGIEPEAAADRTTQLAGGARELVGAAVLGDDPGGLAGRTGRCRLGGEGLGERRRPAKRLETSAAQRGNGRRIAHPTRFSFPVRFAYRSARPKAHRPKGMRKAPITISGQTSYRRSVTGTPVTPLRTPSRT